MQEIKPFTPPILRYKFTQEIQNLLINFANLHQYDDRKTFKEAWIEWTDLNSESLQKETRRLVELNYKGNINEKMYKATRYYFKNKNKPKSEISEISEISEKSEKSEKSTKKTYISLDINILELIDQDIKNNIYSKDYTPASGYENFCFINKELVKKEIDRLIKEHNLSLKESNDKLKKSYKNRYFQFTKS